MIVAVDQALAGGAFIGSAVAAFFTRRTHRQIAVPHERGDPAPTAGALLEDLAKSQTEITAVLVQHIAEDEAFKNDVRNVLTLRRVTDRPRR